MYLADYPELKNLTVEATIIGVFLRTQKSEDIVKRGLSVLGKEYPKLSKATYKEETEKFVLESEEDDAKHQMFFRATKSQDLEFGWGLKSGFQVEDEMSHLMDVIQAGFDIMSIDVELLDIKVPINAYLLGNHYEIIHDTFFSQSPIASIQQGYTIYSNDFGFSSVLDESCIGAVRISSDVNLMEISSGKYANDTMRIVVGMANTKMPLDAKLSVLMDEHIPKAHDYIMNRIFPHFIIPVDNALNILGSEENE